MREAQIIVPFQVFAYEELPAEDRELVDMAKAMTATSYSPYSHFQVGAALRLADGQVFQGSNQENAAFPSGLCAERTAMFHAGATYPDKAMVSLAIAGGVMGRLAKAPATPCGACRQVMAQYQLKGGHPMSVLMIGDGQIWKFNRVDDILPLIFDSI